MIVVQSTVPFIGFSSKADCRLDMLLCRDAGAQDHHVFITVPKYMLHTYRVKELTG